MNNIIIIGNGFDLAHGMETSYTDFVKHMMNEHIEDKSRYSDLFDFSSTVMPSPSYSSPNALPVVLKSYNTLRETIIEQYRTSDIFKNKLIESLVKELSLKNWCDIEAFYFKALYNTKANNTLYFYPEELNSDFEKLKKYLSDYLLAQESDSKEMEEYASFFQQLDSKNTIIVNFNYTRTIHTHYAKYLQNSKIIDIHGQLEDDDNPMIFGYAAKDTEIAELFSRNDNHYLRNIKKVLYKRSQEESKLLGFLKNIENNSKPHRPQRVDISILGHSCGISDNLILEQIFSFKNIEDIYIYYFKDYDSGYYDTHVNLGRIVTGDVWSKVIDFPNSTCMPQHDDVAKGELATFAEKIYKKQRDRSNVISLPVNIIA